LDRECAERLHDHDSIHYVTDAFAGSSITIDKLDKTAITAADLVEANSAQGVGFSAVMGRIVSNPAMEV
jgi:hypothetical protein